MTQLTSDSSLDPQTSYSGTQVSIVEASVFIPGWLIHMAGPLKHGRDRFWFLEFWAYSEAGLESQASSCLWEAGLEAQAFSVWKVPAGLEIFLHGCLSLCCPTYLKTCLCRKCVCECVSSLAYKCQKLEATKVSFSMWIDELWYICIMECYSVISKNEPSSHRKT